MHVAQRDMSGQGCESVIIIAVFALQVFFEQQGTVRSVRMRRHLRSGDFKGSVFVEFDNEELAKEVRRPCPLREAELH